VSVKARAGFVLVVRKRWRQGVRRGRF